jgi:hypothetical protein
VTNGDGTVTLSRRNVLTALVSGATVAGAGCLDAGEDEAADDTTEESRAKIRAVVDIYYHSIDEGNADQLLSVLHPDSIEETFNPTVILGPFSVEIADLTIVDLNREAGTATVQTTVTVERDTGTESKSEELRLRTDDDEWKVWFDGSDLASR